MHRWYLRHRRRDRAAAIGWSLGSIRLFASVVVVEADQCFQLIERDLRNTVGAARLQGGEGLPRAAIAALKTTSGYAAIR